MTREELAEDKKLEYDTIVNEMMNEIRSKEPEKHHQIGTLDGKATDIYREVADKYLPKLNRILKESEKIKEG